MRERVETPGREAAARRRVRDYDGGGNQRTFTPACATIRALPGQ
jgi:hypothetical protein